MTPKTIFIVIISVMITIVLMKNTNEIDFWFFGEMSVSKLAVLGVMFFTGAVVGFILGRPRKKPVSDEYVQEDDTSINKPHSRLLSEEDRDYIS